MKDTGRIIEIINRQAFLEWKLVLPRTEVDRALERLDRAVVAGIGVEGPEEKERATEANPK